jgi:hypothetical protein
MRLGRMAAAVVILVAAISAVVAPRATGDPQTPNGGDDNPRVPTQPRNPILSHSGSRRSMKISAKSAAGAPADSTLLNCDMLAYQPEIIGGVTMFASTNLDCSGWPIEYTYIQITIFKISSNGKISNFAEHGKTVDVIPVVEDNVLAACALLPSNRSLAQFYTSSFADVQPAPDGNGNIQPVLNVPDETPPLPLFC